MTWLARSPRAARSWSPSVSSKDNPAGRARPAAVSAGRKLSSDMASQSITIEPGADPTGVTDSRCGAGRPAARNAGCSRRPKSVWAPAARKTVVSRR
ncbi:hypothetical protein [Actinoplanes sp. NPDC089786]|uniref:hypothetical protein n=1 Tax=Actinoplanes sp. NPDC089786 TaxID=3155185 RepID=UPI0034155162